MNRRISEDLRRNVYGLARRGNPGLAMLPATLGALLVLVAWTPSADAVALHELTAAGCISDLEGADTCGAGNEAQGLGTASGVAVSPDGASVYVVSQADGVARFNRAPDGTLTAAGCISDVDLAQICG